MSAGFKRGMQDRRVVKYLSSRGVAVPASAPASASAESGKTIVDNRDR